MVFRDLRTIHICQQLLPSGREVKGGKQWKSYVKPLMSLNSLVILPPLSVTDFFALQQLCKIPHIFMLRYRPVLLLKLVWRCAIFEANLHLSLVG